MCVCLLWRCALILDVNNDENTKKAEYIELEKTNKRTLQSNQVDHTCTSTHIHTCIKQASNASKTAHLQDMSATGQGKKLPYLKSERVSV